MPRIVISLSEVQKALWVDQAHEERVTLSEWIRRRCDGGLDAGEPRSALSAGPASDSPVGSVPGPSPASSPRPSFPVSVRQFKGPDPKGGKK